MAAYNEVVLIENEGRYTLITRPDGAIMTTEGGHWMIFDTLENRVISLPPTNEVVKFFQKTQSPQTKDSDIATVVINEEIEEEERHWGYNVEQESDMEPINKKKWCREAILLLLDLYKKNIDKFKSTSVKNENVWRDIAAEMAVAGYTYTKHQIEYKFKYLKARYIKKRDNMAAKGTGESPVSFDYFNEFDEIFGRKPNIVPVALASSSSTSSESIEDTPKMTKRPSRLEKEVSSLSQLLKERDEKREEAREKRHKEKQETSQQALKVFETMMGKLLDKL